MNRIRTLRLLQARYQVQASGLGRGPPGGHVINFNLKLDNTIIIVITGSGVQVQVPGAADQQ
jgi:hypothetical protein